MTKLERIRNYFIRTNTDDNTTVEYPAFEARYRLSEDSYFLTSINDASIGEYFKFADLLDGDGNAWTDQATLTAWLRQNTGVSTTGDIMLEVPGGNIDGASSINKFGANQLVPADTESDVWDGGGTYTYPSTTDITHVSQTTDQAALRGALVNVQGLDANWNEITEIVSLDITDSSTPVALATPLIRCFRSFLMWGAAATSSVRVHNLAETVDYAVISNGNGQTLMAQYTIPAGRTGYMTSYYVSNIDATNKTPTSTEIKLKAQDNTHGGIFLVKHANAIPEGGSGFQHEFSPYYRFTEKTDIKITALCADEAGHVHAGFDLILIDN